MEDKDIEVVKNLLKTSLEKLNDIVKKHNENPILLLGNGAFTDKHAIYHNNTISNFDVLKKIQEMVVTVNDVSRYLFEINQKIS